MSKHARELCLASCMGLHARLGDSCLINLIDDNLIRMICIWVIKDAEISEWKELAREELRVLRLPNVPAMNEDLKLDLLSIIFEKQLLKGRFLSTTEYNMVKEQTCDIPGKPFVRLGEAVMEMRKHMHAWMIDKTQPDMQTVWIKLAAGGCPCWLGVTPKCG
jgi:hypothetical protein